MKNLSEYKTNITSQYGEDGIVSEILKTIGVRSRSCVEFGAWDGKHLSNTWNLVANEGWNCLYVEQDPRKYEELRRFHLGNQKVTCICKSVSHTGDNSLDTILSNTPLPDEFDLLSIDVDGNDYHIWSALRKYRPRIVIIEVNPTIPPPIEFVGEPGNTNVGSSSTSMVRLGKQKGYELVAHTGVNAIFVVQEEFPKLDIADNRIEILFDNTHVTYLLSTWDGRNFLSRRPVYGFRKLTLWSVFRQSMAEMIGKYLLKSTSSDMHSVMRSLYPQYPIRKLAKGLFFSLDETTT
jgi:hypothetical protein